MVDSLSPDGILALLSPAQRDAFDTTLRDPSKLSALVAAEFEAESPWWDTSDAASSSSETIELQTERPEIVNVELLPPLKIGEDGKPMVTTKLVYNVLAVMFVIALNISSILTDLIRRRFAYSYTCRTLSISSFSSLAPGSSEGIAALAMIAQLVPFLTETSTVVLDDIGEAIEYVVSREKQDVRFNLHFRPFPQLIWLLPTDDWAALTCGATAGRSCTFATFSHLNNRCRNFLAFFSSCCANSFSSF